MIASSRERGKETTVVSGIHGIATLVFEKKGDGERRLGEMSDPARKLFVSQVLNISSLSH